MAIKIANRLIRYGRSSISGVTYTREALEKMVAEWNASKKNVTLGYIPDSTTPRQYLDLSRAATKVTDMWLDDEGLVVEQEILDTPMGNIMRALVDASLEETVPQDRLFSLSANIVGSLDNGYNGTDLKFRGVFIDAPNQDK